MTPTAELRLRLRELLDEVIPDEEGATAADTRFSDARLDFLLTESTTVYWAASLGWLAKAGMYQREMGAIESMGVGAESITLASLRNQQDYAHHQSVAYRDLHKRERHGSWVLPLSAPEV